MADSALAEGVGGPRGVHGDICRRLSHLCTASRRRHRPLGDHYMAHVQPRGAAAGAVNRPLSRASSYPGRRSGPRWPRC